MNWPTLRNKPSRPRTIIFFIIFTLTLTEIYSAPEKKITELSKEDRRFLNEMSTELKKIQSLETWFVQKRFIKLFLDSLTSEGVFYYENPDRLRWEIQKPYKSILIYNGTDAAMFGETNGKITKKKSSDMKDIMRIVLKQIATIIQGDFDTLKDSYSMSLEKNKSFHKIVLSPISKNGFLKSLVLFVNHSDLHISKIIIMEHSGDRTEINYYKEKINPVIKKGLFDLENPLLSN